MSQTGTVPRRLRRPTAKRADGPTAIAETTGGGALRLVDVSKSFERGDEKVHALRRAKLNIDRGEFVSVIGPSGSGKSTLLYLAGGFLAPDRGSVYLAGKDLASCSGRDLARLRRTEVGFVFQFFHLIGSLTVWENVALPLVAGRARGIDTRVAAALEVVGLSGRRDHRPSELSGGEMQRVAIARALVISPSVIIADEPTGNLDSRSSEAVIDVFVEAVREAQVALVLVTHDPRVADRADTVIELRDGSPL